MSFWTRVDSSGGPHACWPWLGAQGTDGYGIVRHLGSVVGTHRVAYLLGRGLIPSGHVVRHMCTERSTSRLPRADERMCCNPAHLETGTHAANAEDRESVGRGSGNRHARRRAGHDRSRRRG